MNKSKFGLVADLLGHYSGARVSPRMKALRLAAVVFLLGALSFASGVHAEGQRTWSRGFSSEPANSVDRSREFVLYDLSQDEQHLIGRWSYTNGAVDNVTPPRVTIEGTKTADGTFWPDVKLEVRKTRTGKWKPIGNSPDGSQPAAVIIEPNTTNFDLAVNLDPFKRLIGKYESGRIVLKTGRTSVFELKDLMPPEQETEKANDESRESYSGDPDVQSATTLANTRLGSSIDDFRSVWGPPSDEESLVRTASLKWKLRGAKGESIVPGVFAIEIAFLDGIACEIALRSKERITRQKLAKLTKPFLTTFRKADFAQPLNDARTYKLSNETLVWANKHNGHTVIVIKGAAYTRNEDVFDREAATVRPPTSNH